MLSGNNLENRERLPIQFYYKVSHCNKQIDPLKH